MALHIVEEAERCLNCNRPLCQRGCPEGTPIPQAIQLFLERKMVDTVIVAVSQKPKNKLILTTEGLEGDERGLLIVDENGQTTVPVVFAAGDVVTGPNTVVHAVAATKIAVRGMLEYMGTREREEDC